MLAYLLVPSVSSHRSLTTASIFVGNSPGTLSKIDDFVGELFCASLDGQRGRWLHIGWNAQDWFAFPSKQVEQNRCDDSPSRGSSILCISVSLDILEERSCPQSGFEQSAIPAVSI